jgi:hypothetical protein
LPQLGSVHKDGRRWVGVDDPQLSDELYRAGTPPMHRLDQRTVTSLVSDVRVGDVLSISFDGVYWWAASETGTIGRLTWFLSAERQRDWLDYKILFPRSGSARISRLLVTSTFEVVNCGGVVLPSK